MKEIFREATLRGLLASSFGFFRQEMKKQYSGLRLAGVWLSMFWCVLRHGSSPAEYAHLNFDKKSDRERARYFTMFRFERFIKKANAGDKRLFVDKTAFNRRFAPYLGRDWLDLSKASFEEFAGFVRSHGQVMLKATSLSCGKGISRYTYDPADDLRALYDANRDMLAEQVVVQHPDLAAFNPGSTNVPRLNTMVDSQGNVHVFSAFLRTGCGEAVVDNMGAGGMAAHIDVDTGVVTTPAIDMHRREYIAHPVTGKVFLGFTVPRWEEAKAAVIAAAKETPDMRYIGWDVAVTADGVCLIEGNDRADICVRQFVDRRGWYRELTQLL